MKHRVIPLLLLLLAPACGRCDLFGTYVITMFSEGGDCFFTTKEQAFMLSPDPAGFEVDGLDATLTSAHVANDSCVMDIEYVERRSSNLLTYTLQIDLDSDAVPGTGTLVIDLSDGNSCTEKLSILGTKVGGRSSLMPAEGM